MPADRIEWGRVRSILEECPPLDEYQAYYRQFAVPHRRISALIPQTRAVLEGAFEAGMRVLDVGCGRADTLIACTDRFSWGAGIDESAAVMIAEAKAARARAGARNVDFYAAKAVALPFADETFDLVFSERGPLGHNDRTLREALRVLRPGGLLFIETIGEWNSWETRLAFEAGYQRPASLTGGLEIEGERLVRHGVRVHSLASRFGRMEFASVEDWLRYQIYSWSPPGREAFTEENLPAIHAFQEIASDRAGRITITGHTLWMAGTKGTSTL
jgi:SAM-dependent methyltransferase